MKRLKKIMVIKKERFLPQHLFYVLKKTLKNLKPLLVLCYLGGGCETAQALSNGNHSPFSFHITGSSLVAPFAACAATRYEKRTKKPLPFIEASGTSAGLYLFSSSCNAPQVLMTSRPLTRYEKNLCKCHPTEEIIEIPIGFDAVVFVQSQRSHPLPLTLGDLKKALFSPTPLSSWEKITKNLCSAPLYIVGPSPASGMREWLVKFFSPLKPHIPLDFQTHHYHEGGDNQNVIVQKVCAVSHGVGIVSFSFYQKNKNDLRFISFHGPGSIESALQTKRYPFLRPLFLYIKKTHASKEVMDYIQEFLRPEVKNFDGYLFKKGLVPLLAGS